MIIRRVCEEHFFFFLVGTGGYFYWSGRSRKRPRNGAGGKKDSHTDKRKSLRQPTIKRLDPFNHPAMLSKSLKVPYPPHTRTPYDNLFCGLHAMLLY